MMRCYRVHLFQRCTVLLIAALALCACLDTADGQGDAAHSKASDEIEFDGKVVHVALEGGFWGIVDEQGRRYDPAGLPTEFQRDGLRIKVRARRVTDRLSSRMWGTAIELVDIRAL